MTFGHADNVAPVWLPVLCAGCYEPLVSADDLATTVTRDGFEHYWHRDCLRQQWMRP